MHTHVSQPTHPCAHIHIRTLQHTRALTRAHTHTQRHTPDHARVPTHGMIAPVVPAITDEFIERTVARLAEARVNSAGWIMMRLPHEVAPLFREWLDVHYPDRAAKVMALVQEMRGGRDNEHRFHERFRPKGAWADGPAVEHGGHRPRREESRVRGLPS